MAGTPVVVVAWMDAALETAQFVPYATGVAEALGADLRLIRGVCHRTEVADAAGADLFLVMNSRLFSWRGIRSSGAARWMLRRARTPVCVVSSETVERGLPFKPDRVECEVALDGTDAPLIAEAASLSERAGGLLQLRYTLPETGDHLLARGVEGAEGSPLSYDEAVRRIAELGVSIPAPHATVILTGARSSWYRPPSTGFALVVTRPRDAMATLRACPGWPVISVPPAVLSYVRGPEHHTRLSPASV